VVRLRKVPIACIEGWCASQSIPPSTTNHERKESRRDVSGAFYSTEFIFLFIDRRSDYTINFFCEA
jgi:hypothetical protein